MSKVCIAGAGSWGLALALVLEKNGHEVTVWSALPEEIRLLKEEHENKRSGSHHSTDNKAYG